MKPKDVLITGAGGFIGSNMCRYLMENTDWNITGTRSRRYTMIGEAQKVSPRMRYITFDLRDPMPYIGQFDYIINLASDSHVEHSIRDPVGFIENNTSIMLNVLEYARHYPPRAFIQFSTEEVYGTANHSKWDVLLPGNPYAASKAAQEMIAISYWKTYKVPVVITNSNNIVGPGQSKDSFIPKVIEHIKEGQEVPIYTSKGKPGVRYWNSVNNISSAILFILNRTPAMYPDSDRPNRHSLSGGVELDNLKMAQLVAEMMGKELRYKLIEAENIRPGYNKSYIKMRSPLEWLGWEPVETLKEGLSWI